MRLSVFWKFFISMAVVVAIGMGIIGGLGYHFTATKTREQIDQQYLEKVKIQGQEIWDYLRGVEEDVLFLSRTPPIQGIIRARQGQGYDPVDKSSYGAWIKRLRVIFKNIARAKKRYFQIRYIDENGQELIKVVSAGKKVKSIPAGELQNKADRDYFIETVKLEPGEIFISPLSLNREEGKVQLPAVPTVRFATPIFDDKGKQKGIVVVNLFAREFLRRPSFNNEMVLVFIVDQEGYYLRHSQSDLKEFGGAQDRATGENLKKDYPAEVADQILSGKIGEVRSRNAEIFYAPIHPYKDADQFWVLGEAVPLSLTLAPLRTFSIVFISLILSIFILAIIFSVIVTRIIADPIKRLKIAADLAKEGRFDECLKYCRIKTGDEREALGEAMYLMVQKIQNDIEGLKKVDRMKTEFLSMVSHELRTPLTPIKGYLSLLRQGVQGELSEQQKETISRIIIQAAHLEDLISSILDFSRLESGKKFQINREQVSLAKKITEAIEGMRWEFERKEVGLAVDISSDLPAIIGDEAKIGRVIANILGNALRFTPRQGRVELIARATEREVITKISDTGIGLAREQLAKIFDKFYQVDTSLTREYGGIGMGLTIAKQMVEAHGGKMWAESAGLGQGTTLVFTLPISG